ncbi:MAG: type I DNA topoisomerase [Nitrospirae bacterium]|nr:type I DNA topoisomerase [Nitrospirota bacterium]MBI3353005.1 type I DNA topoisomerase [Nitrospirota bacterium]
MAKSLIIVESPSKAKTINKYLGKNYTVKASVGHIRDLPKSKLGIDLKKNFKPEYTVIRGKKKILDEILEAAEKADKIYLASDPDREGEAIAWHIAEEISGGSKKSGKKKKSSQKIFRVLFNEITQKAIKKAMDEPGEIDLNKVNAQQARRVLDRIVGYTISPLLWEKVKRGLSAGRVQSVAVRMICEREAEILKFVSEEYWSITAHLSSENPPPFSAKLISIGDNPLSLANEEVTRTLLRQLETRDFVVEKIEKKERKRNPVPPFITSKLQQEGSRKLRFTPKKTMMLAQQLYEGIELGEEGPVGLITYMRTDSIRISPDAQQEAIDLISQKYGREYLPDQPNVYKSKKNTQDAHEAIRPTSLSYDPETIKASLSKDQYLLYKIIWNRFMASQMRPAILEVTKVDIKAGDALFRANGNIVVFPGFTIVYSEGKEENGTEKQGDQKENETDDEEHTLPNLAEGQRLPLDHLEPKQHFTQPPPRYNEALLIKELEENGIGRPSTYATIISTIQDRDYVEKIEGRLKPSELGKIVNGLLVESFPDLVNPEFTAKMEENLDNVEEGGKKWTDTVKDFYKLFEKDLEKAQLEMRDVKREEIPTDIPCERCQKKMVIKWGRNGRFLACPGYPECKNTHDFMEDADGKIKVIQKEVSTNEICEKCGQPMIIKVGRFGRFMACSNYPECKTTKALSIGVKCPREGCNGEVTQRRSKKGRVFYGCTAYPKCDFAVWDRPVPKICPQCQAPYLVEKVSRAGIKVKCANKECQYEEEAVAA